LLAEAIASISFALVCYQDFKERMVSDLAWLPAVIAVPVAMWEAGPLWWIVVAKIGFLAFVSMVGLLLQAFGEGDAIGLTLMGVGVSTFSPLPQLVAMAVAALLSITILGLRFGTLRVEKVIPLEEAAKQNIWIPVEIIVNGSSVEPRGPIHNRSKLYKMIMVMFGAGVGLANSYTLVRSLGLIYTYPEKAALIMLLGVVAGISLGYLVQRGGSKYEDAWESLNQYKDMQASVKVAYGVPLVGYMGIGYLCYLAFLFVTMFPIHL
jgi:hypothetical protein